MAASLIEIKKWFDEAAATGATHMIVMCDDYDYIDYPVFCKSEEETRAKLAHPGDRVMEVYKISLGWGAQATGRVCNV